MSINAIISTSAADGTIDMGKALTCLAIAVVLGLVISCSYVVAAKKRDCSPAFVIATVILPAVTAAVIILVGSNVARAFSIAGIFALIRFRSQPGDAKDISYVFLCAVTGLGCGLGYVGFAAAFSISMCLLFVVVSIISGLMFKETSKDLKILIPEDMNYQDVFDEIFAKYTKKCELIKVKTTNLGSMYELSYIIEMKNDSDDKAMMDDLRCKNGNLNVVLCKHENRKDQL